jgi:hypothetical protein
MTDMTFLYYVWVNINVPDELDGFAEGDAIIDEKMTAVENAMKDIPGYIEHEYLDTVE